MVSNSGYSKHLRKNPNSYDYLFFVGFLTFVSVVKITQCTTVTTIDDAKDYLSKFGYLPTVGRNSGTAGLLDFNTWHKALKDFQRFAGLNVSGKLDAETKRLMSLPRCGVRDMVVASATGRGRSKRYALLSRRWRAKALSYKISKFSKHLKREDVKAEIARAFALWSQYTDLTFTAKENGSVHIEIRFEEGEHGDGNPFDGRGNTLAHAFSPLDGGDTHFDDSEIWSIGAPYGTDLFQVAVHEFGHSLGLDHSEVETAAMTPFYYGFDPYFKLDADDVLAIQALYGRRTTGRRSPAIEGSFGTGITQRPHSQPKLPRDKEICEDPKVDALFNSVGGRTYAFKGNKYYRLTGYGVADGYPKLISEGWPGLPGDIDAAFTYKNGKTYFFKGTQYWVYKGRTIAGDYPQKISHGFAGIPDHLDSALLWADNNKIYFYKGSKFWRFDPMGRPPVKSSYPKPISNWLGLPNNLDAALQYKGRTYFFKGDKYYRFDDRTFAVDLAYPPYPRPSGQRWFGCKAHFKADRYSNLQSIADCNWLVCNRRHSTHY